jgi:ABC-2 type transport system ATP-binding protein
LSALAKTQAYAFSSWHHFSSGELTDNDRQEMMESEEPTLQAAEPNAIETTALTRRFGDMTAVDNLDLHIPYGQIFGLLGPNGAGKSTTVKMLTTLLDPSSGTAVVAGFDVVKTPAEVRRRIGYVPQMLSADGALTGRENLTLSAKLYGMARADRTSRIQEALAFMGLTDAGDKLVKTYSGGMIRRLEVAQAMLHRPTVLFLDEPTIGLDPVARHTVWERLRVLRRDFNMTILMTTHDMDEADVLCDALALLHRGKVAVTGKPADLKAALGVEATLDDVFVQYAGASIQEGGNYGDIGRTRRTARRLG